MDPEPGQGLREMGEALVLNLLAADESAGPGLDVRQRPETIVFEFPDKVRIIKSGPDSGRGYRGNAGQHGYNYRGWAEARQKAAERCLVAPRQYTTSARTRSQA